MSNEIKNISGENSSEEYSEGLQISFILFKHKWFIISTTLVGIIASVIIMLNKPNEYLAVANVVPPKQKSSLLEGAMSSISSALQDFGLTSLGGSADGSYSFLAILQSRSIKDSLLDKFDLVNRYEDLGEPKKHWAMLKLEENMEVSLEKQGNYTIAIWDTSPDTAAIMANAAVEIANNIAVRIFKEETSLNLKYVQQRIASADSVIEFISAKLADYSKKYKLFSPEDQAKSINQAYAELKLKSMEAEISYDLMKNMFGSQDPYTKMQEKLSMELKKKLRKAEDEPGFAGDFKLEDATGVAIDYMRMLAEIESLTKIKALLIPMLEQMKIDEKRNVENLFVVDEAQPPMKKDRPRRSFYVAGTAFGSFIIGILLVLAWNSYRRFNSQYKEYKKQF